MLAIFANFWSTWSLMNTYVTMLHTEDLLHRSYYVVHISLSFLMALTITDPDHNFFNWAKLGWYHALASIVCRLVTLLMWCRALLFRDLEDTKDPDSM